MSDTETVIGLSVEKIVESDGIVFTFTDMDTGARLTIELVDSKDKRSAEIVHMVLSDELISMVAGLVEGENDGTA